MSSELVQINNLKDNEFEFELVVEGLKLDDVDAKFVIESKGVDLAFPCKRNTDGKWSVKLPPLPMLERTVYPFHLQVIAEGYHFRPMKGSLNIVGSNDVYVANMEQKFASPTEQPKKEVKETTLPQPSNPSPVRSREKSIAQLAEEMTSQVKKEEKRKHTPRVVKEAPVVLNETPSTILPKIDSDTVKEEKKGEKDEAVLAILQEVGFKTKKLSKKYPRFKNKD